MIRRRQNRYGGSKPEIWYHGTSVKNLRSILTHGLQGSRKSRYTGEMESFGGVYLSERPGTAWEFSLDFAGQTDPPSALIVAVQVSPRSLILDEDAVTNDLGLAFLPENLRNHPVSALKTYFEVSELDDLSVGTERAWSQYAYEVVTLGTGLAGSRNSKFFARLESFAYDAFPIALQNYITFKVFEDKQWTRQNVLEAYTAVYGKRAVELLSGDVSFMLPTWKEQRGAYQRMVTDFTKLVKKNTKSFGKGRFLGDIGFRGRNKIVGVWSYTVSRTRDEYKKIPVLLTVHYGFIPTEALNFFQGYYTSIAIQ